MQRRRLTETQRVEIWERLASGEPAPSVARAYGCFPNAIRQMQLLTGGAKPRTRTQRSSALSLAEREEISRGVVLHLSCRGIATRVLTVVHVVIWYAAIKLARQPILRIGIFGYPGQTPERYALRVVCCRSYFIEECIVIYRVGFYCYSEDTLPHPNHRFDLLIKVAHPCCVGQFDWWHLCNT